MKPYLLLLAVVSSVLLKSSVQGLNICGGETGCFCDNIEPYLIQCSEINLKTLFSPDDWQETIEKQNISDLELDVRFDANYLEEIPVFPALKIVSLSFRNNRLHKIENYAFKELDFLQSLDLSQNEFTAKDLPEYVFGGKWNESEYQPMGLVHLNLSSNSIHTVEQDLFDHLPSLNSLDLSYNPLRILAGSTSMSIAQLMNLKYLNLAYTQISLIPTGMIHNFLDLESLDLSGNKLTEVPKEILNTHKLKVLTLDNNRFEKFDEESFAGLTTVEDLSISNMDTLRLIEARAFGSMKNLTRFYCHHNPNLNRINNAAFYEIAENPDDWPVREIYLNDNGLTHIDKALANWVLVQKVDIQNNPFRCDCDLKWMTEVLVQQITRSNPEFALNLVCAEPKDNKGNSIVELGLETESFTKCRTGVHQLNGAAYELDPELQRRDDYHQAVAITVLVIGVMLTVIGLSILGVIVVKRRAIASALIAHQQIRYQRADDDEFEHEAYKSPSSSVYRVA